MPAYADEIEPSRRACERPLAIQRNVPKGDRGDAGAAAVGSTSAAATAMAARSGFTARTQGDGHRRPAQGIRPHPDRILTVVGLPHLRAFLLTAVVVVTSLAVVAPASAAAPRVLVAELADDINPVSQGYLAGPSAAGRDRRLRRARRRARHARRSRQLDARGRQELPGVAGARGRLRQPGWARAPIQRGR